MGHRTVVSAPTKETRQLLEAAVALSENLSDAPTNRWSPASGAPSIDFCEIGPLIPPSFEPFPPPTHQAAALEVFNTMRSPSKAGLLGGTTDTKGAGGLLAAPHETAGEGRDQDGAGGGVTGGGGIVGGANGAVQLSGSLISAVWCRTIATVAQVRSELRSRWRTYVAPVAPPGVRPSVEAFVGQWSGRTFLHPES